MSLTPVTAALSTLCGVLVAGGLFVVVVAFVPHPVRLSDALALLDGRRSQTPETDAAPDTESRLGAWAYRTLHVPVSARAAHTLQLRGESLSSFYADKVVLALVGLVCPGLLGVLAGLLFQVAWSVPLIAGLVGGVVGFFVPDLNLRRAGEAAKSDASEALFTFFDLVTLERLANQSASQSLYAAARMSDSILFRRILAALDRARLEQQPPYAELTRLADELGLPELRDVADVMRLDEQGAALVGTLRARVRELRDVHLTRQKVEAHEISERMTIFMVLPAMVFALIFLAPPLLRLMSSS